MAQGLTRTPFHSARLVHVLAELGLVDAAASGQGFAEKLGQWVGIKDAITLRAAHAPLPPKRSSNTARQAAAGAGATAAATATFAQVRAAVEQALHRSAQPPAAKPGARAGLELPRPKPGVPIELAWAYEPYRRYYLAQQREMEQAARPLRTRLRALLAQASPALQQLAALDAALDGILNEREAQLLAGLPALLERRFKHLRAIHQQHVQDQQQTDQPALWMQPGAWLARYCQELHSVLLAEWDLRLQPTLGLLEALQHDTSHAL